jgi:diphthamide biosynthesis protein 4
MTNLYEILGVKPDASLEEIRKAYQTLILRFHPDKRREGKNDTDKYIRIDEAWKVLRDDEKRRVYDAELTQKQYSDDFFVNEVLTRDDFIRNESEDIYYYRCRCGGYYIMPDQPPDEVCYISCDECSLVIQLCPKSPNSE